MRKALLVCTLLTFSWASQAQCAMCKAAAQSDLEGGAGAADGLNGGILYLMVFHYLLMGGVGYLWYRQRSQKGDASEV